MYPAQGTLPRREHAVQLATQSEAEPGLRYEAPAWAQQIWNDQAEPTFNADDVLARHKKTDVAALTAPLLLYREQEPKRAAMRMIDRATIGLIAFMLLYMAGHFIAAWAAGRP